MVGAARLRLRDCAPLVPVGALMRRRRQHARGHSRRPHADRPNVASVVVDAGPAEHVSILCSPRSPCAFPAVRRIARPSITSKSTRVLRAAHHGVGADPDFAGANGDERRLAGRVHAIRGRLQLGSRRARRTCKYRAKRRVRCRCKSSATRIHEVPADCSGHGTEEDTVAAFGANGIFGVGVFRAGLRGGLRDHRGQRRLLRLHLDPASRRRCRSRSGAESGHLVRHGQQRHDHPVAERRRARRGDGHGFADIWHRHPVEQ